MTKLEQLIQELCPDGVEYKRLGDIAQIGTGSSNGNESEENGKYPFFVRSQFVKAKNAYEYDEEAIIIPGEGGIGDIFHYVNGKYALHQRVYRIHFTADIVNTRFAYYYMAAFFKQFILRKAVNATVSSIRKPMIEDFAVPLPPLPVQQKIVRILDSFTGLTAELTAELTARRKQYEYYRDELLTFGNDVPMVKLGDIATDIYRGAGVKRDEVTTDGIPCVRYGEIYTSYEISFTECISHTREDVIASPKYFEHGDIIFTITGESVEEIAKSIAYLGNDKCIAGGDTVVLKHQQEPRYLSYALSTTAAQAQKSKGKVKSKVVHSSIPALKEIEIPLPNIETQKHIANLLDSFHQLCNDLTSGLPAEIEARQKQYEYYRDKLLKFKSLSRNS